MNRGGLGYIDVSQPTRLHESTDGARARLILPQSLLQPLAIRDEGRAYGFYYPTPTGRGHDERRFHHDIMIAAIPPRYWAVCGALTVHLKHVPGALAHVAAFLAEHKVVFIDTECSRAAHRYATWNLTIVFEALRGDSQNTFDPTKSAYSRTARALMTLVRQMRSRLTKFLFTDVNDPTLRFGVTGEPIRTLAYFHDWWQSKHTSRAARKIGSSAPAAPFPLASQPGGVLLGASSDFATLLLTIQEQEHSGPNGGPTFPAVTFAEVDTTARNIRSVIIPHHKLTSFFRLELVYERASLGTCRGLLAHIAKQTSPTYNLWRVYNHTFRNEESEELGHFHLVIEDLASESSDRLKRIERFAKSFVDGSLSLPSSAVTIARATARSIDPHEIQKEVVSSNRSAFTHDVFISHAECDREFATRIYQGLELVGVHGFLAQVQIQTGDRWPMVIRDALIKSRELCLVWGSKCRRSEWVMREWGVAWALGRPIRVFLLPGEKIRSLPELLRDTQVIRVAADPEAARTQLEKYCREQHEKGLRALQRTSVEDYA